MWQRLHLLPVRAKPYEGNWRSPKSDLALPGVGGVCSETNLTKAGGVGEENIYNRTVYG